MNTMYLDFSMAFWESLVGQAFCFTEHVSISRADFMFISSLCHHSPLHVKGVKKCFCSRIRSFLTLDGKMPAACAVR